MYFRLGQSDALSQLDYVTFDCLVFQWAVCRGISQGEYGPGALISHLDGLEPRGSDWKSGRRIKIPDEAIHSG